MTAKEELKQMLEAGMIDRAYYDEMTREEAMGGPPVTDAIQVTYVASVTITATEGLV